MFKNGLTYYSAIALLFLTHLSMLSIVLVRGNYEAPADFALLTAGVLALDIVYLIVTKIYKQMTYTTDFMLLCVLGMSIGIILSSVTTKYHTSITYTRRIAQSITAGSGL